MNTLDKYLHNVTGHYLNEVRVARSGGSQSCQVWRKSELPGPEELSQPEMKIEKDSFRTEIIDQKTYTVIQDIITVLNANDLLENCAIIFFFFFFFFYLNSFV